MKLGLRPSVKYATIGDDIILLDIAANRYFAVPLAKRPSFHRMLDHSDLSISDCRELKPYVDCGMLVEGQCTGPRPPLSTVGLRALDLDRTMLKPEHLLRAILGRYRSRIELKIRSFSGILSGIAKSKRNHSMSRSVEDMHLVASSFRRTSGLFARHDQCLPLSIALVRECIRKRLPAQFVVGVHTTPFNAHAWVQIEDILINDDPNFVKDFTPILVV